MGVQHKNKHARSDNVTVAVAVSTVAFAIGSGTRMTNSRASIQLTLHVANRVPIPRYRKSTLRMPMMISSLCSAPHDKKDNEVERSSSGKPVHGVFEPNGNVNRSRDMVSPAVYPRLFLS